jgi:cytoskeletal protein RodZ
MMPALGIGLVLVSVAIFFSYRSMESDLSLEKTSAPSVITAKPVDSASHSVASATPRANTKAPVSQSALIAASAQPLSTTEEVIVEEAPAPAPPPIPGAFAMAKLTNVPQVDQERLADIAQEFNDKVKAAGWDTTSPAYHEAWKKAAEESEEVLKAAIGVQAWQELKMRQAQED